jgi:hypothetical protein
VKVSPLRGRVVLLNATGVGMAGNEWKNIYQYRFW